MLENLKERKSPVKTEKENYEYCPSLIGWSLTILVLMAGTIYFSINYIQVFSMILILLFAITFFVTIVLSGYCIHHPHENKKAKIAFYCFYELLFLFLLYALIYLFTLKPIHFSLGSYNASVSQIS